MYFSLKAYSAIKSVLEKPESIAYDKPRKLPEPKTMTGATTPIIHPRT